MSESTFDFLALPRELRNMVYLNYAFGPRTPSDPHCLNIGVLSQQIRAEYRQEILHVVSKRLAGIAMRIRSTNELRYTYSIPPPTVFSDLFQPTITITLHRTSTIHLPLFLGSDTRDFLAATPSFARRVHIALKFDETPIRIPASNGNSYLHRIHTLRPIRETLRYALVEVCDAISDFVAELPTPRHRNASFFDTACLTACEISWPEQCYSVMDWDRRFRANNSAHVFRPTWKSGSRNEKKFLAEHWDKRMVRWEWVDSMSNRLVVKVAWGKGVNFWPE